MEFKFLPMIAIMVAMFPVPNEASLRWLKLNKSPVCFGAKGDDFGRFSYHGNIFVKSFKLVHLSGKVSCLKKKRRLQLLGMLSQTPSKSWCNLDRSEKQHTGSRCIDSPEHWMVQSARIQLFLPRACVRKKRQASCYLCEQRSASVVWRRFERTHRRR